MPAFKIGATALKEYRLKTFGDIISALSELDVDEGVRITARIERLKGGGFIFITRTRSGFALNTCDRMFDRRRGLYVAKNLGEIFEVGSVDDVRLFVNRNAKRPLEAVRY